MKKHSVPLKATATMDNLAKTLTFQGTIRAIELDHIYAQEMLRQPVWSELPTSGHVTTVCESLLKIQFDRISLYEARWIGVGPKVVTYNK